MSKITFRADDELIERLEAHDASKSEVMREALRAHLSMGAADSEQPDPDGATVPDQTLEELVMDRVDAIVAARLPEVGRGGAQDVNVNITVDGPAVTDAETHSGAGADGEPVGKRRAEAATGEAGVAEHGTQRRCGQCGEALESDHVHCPNCGERAARRVFCDCGDELRSDWAFCPGCGRRTPAADVLDRS